MMPEHSPTLLCVCDRVKFRDTEDLQVLTASRQSGGERSVSTILYLISIQVRRHCHACLGPLQKLCQYVWLHSANRQCLCACRT